MFSLCVHGVMFLSCVRDMVFSLCAEGVMFPCVQCVMFSLCVQDVAFLGEFFVFRL